MAIVLLVGTLAIVALTSNSARARLQDEVAAVALFLQQARLQATETGRNVEITFNQQDGTLEAGTRSHEFARGITSPTPSTALRIRPSGENEGLVLTLVSGDLSRTVEIDWLTGRVRLPQ